MGNRRTKTQLGSPATLEYSYDAADRLQSITGVNYPGYSYGYDSNGNQTSRSTDRAADLFGWDTENRLTTATVHGTTATYAYRPDGLRHSKTVGGSTTTYVWDANRSIPVLLQDGANSYLWGHGLMGATDSSGTQTYFLADGLGSTHALTDSTGIVVARRGYDVFGTLRIRTATAATKNPLRGSSMTRGQANVPPCSFPFLARLSSDPGLYLSSLVVDNRGEWGIMSIEGGMERPWARRRASASGAQGALA